MNHRIYVASRASVPERVAMWHRLRVAGHPIISSWIDADLDGRTMDYSALWQRITDEVRCATAFVFYAEPGDFPMKGAFVEVGIAIGIGIPVIAVLPGVKLESRTLRPVGSWVSLPSVRRIDNIEAAFDEIRTMESRGDGH